MQPNIQKGTVDPTPKIKKVLHEIGVRAKVRDMTALEIFAGNGKSHVKDYADMVDRLDAWENNPKLVEEFKQNIPVANIKLCDSYIAAKSMLHQGHYDLIVVDNNLMQLDHIEHFDLFPDVFYLLKPRGYLILTVVLDPKEYYREREDKGIDIAPLLAARNKFYDISAWFQTGINMVEHFKKCFLQAYFERAKDCKREITWHYWQKRNSSHVYYLAIEAK
jgi:hypothetical protein